MGVNGGITMVNLRVQETNLVQLVETVESASFRKIDGLHTDYGTLDSTDWQVYERITPHSQVRDIAYLSDACELLVRSIFTHEEKLSDYRGQEQGVLTEMLLNYDNAQKRLVQINETGNKATAIAAGVGAIIGMRAGLPGMIGLATIASGVAQSIKYIAMDNVERRLQRYLTDRNVLTGDEAYKNMIEMER